MFQKRIIEKYISRLDKKITDEKYALFRSIFANPEKQENIRNSKEEQYQEGFLRDLFVSVLGYTINPEPNYNLLTEQKNVSKGNDNRKADGAIIFDGKVKAVIELKGTDTTDLNKIESQAFLYKEHNPECKYVVISNFERLRFYVENAIEFVEFNLFNLSRDDFQLLFLCLDLNQIKNDIPLHLKHETLSQEKEITDSFYGDYSLFKRNLFEDIYTNNPDYDKLLLFKKTQKLLDRILFILFCSDRGLLPENSVNKIIAQWEQLKDLDAYQPLYSRFQNFFNRINEGYTSQKNPGENVFAYNGGLFKPDEILDNIKIGDDVLFLHSKRLSDYDFESQISVDILGHIFEHSLTEIEEVQNQIEAEKSGLATNKTDIGKRKKDGVFYTPSYITKYIVENTIGKLCDEKKEELGIKDSAFSKTKKSAKDKDSLNKRLDDYKSWLLGLKILDPACGSGAFLNAALKQLKIEHTLIDYYRAKIYGDAIIFQDVENEILEKNIFGVDINEESVEIAKLSLWLHTAQRNRKLTSLNNNIKCGNSLISDPDVAGTKAFDWQKEFPEVFGKVRGENGKVKGENGELRGENGKVKGENYGGFDVVIGNPPYVQLQSMGGMSDVYARCGYESYNKSADLYCLFAERGFKLLKKGGLLSFIMPNKWMLVDYGKDLRRFLSKTNLRQILNFGDIQFFKDATTYVCIFVSQNAEKNGTVKALSLNRKTYHGDFLNEVANGLHEYDASDFGENEWSIQNPEHKAILEKMAKHKALKDFPIEIYRGILTGYNDAFYIDGETRKRLIAEDPKSADLIQPMFRGRDITAWTSSVQDQYLISTFPAIKLDIENYPAIKNHLLSFGKERLEQSGKKGSRKKTSNAWFETQDTISYYQEFAKPKIIYPNMTSIFPFCYDESGAVCNDKAFIITEKEGKSLDFPNPCGNLLKYLLAVLNSKPAKLWIWYNCPELQGGTREIRKAYFENFPIPDLSTLSSQLSTLSSHLSTFTSHLSTLTSDLQKKTGNFLRIVKETFNMEKTSAKLETFYDLSFEEFIRELRQKITPKVKLEWLELFEGQKSTLQKIKEEIKECENELNSIVCRLYGLSDEETLLITDGNL